MNGPRPVHFQQRTQNSSANRTFGKRAQPLAAFNPDREPAATRIDIRPTSAARLAAEAAFTAPHFHPLPTSQAQITVRRTRVGALVMQPPADGSTPVTGSDANSQRAKRPRVFRVDPQHPAAAAASVPPQRPQETPPADRSATASKTRKRRVTADKQPGPISHVVHTLPIQAKPTPFEPQLHTLIPKLASVMPILESIERTQSFWFIDDRFAKEWHRLWQQAEEIRQELQAGFG